MFKRLGRKQIYQDKWLTLYQDQVEFPDGSKGTYAVANRKNGVAIVVVTPDQKLLLSKEYRYVIDAFDWEIPGGGIDEGESPENAATRELYEETGIKVENVNRIGMFYPLHSFNTEEVTLFYTQIEESDLSSDKKESSEEFAEQRFVDFSKALEMIDTGEIIDAMTANAIQLVTRKLQA